MTTKQTQKRLAAAIMALRMCLKLAKDPTTRSVVEDSLLELQEELSLHKKRILANATKDRGDE